MLCYLWSVTVDYSGVWSHYPRKLIIFWSNNRGCYDYRDDSSNFSHSRPYFYFPLYWPSRVMFWTKLDGDCYRSSLWTANGSTYEQPCTQRVPLVDCWKKFAGSQAWVKVEMNLLKFLHASQFVHRFSGSLKSKIACNFLWLLWLRDERGRQKNRKAFYILHQSNYRRIKDIRMSNLPRCSYSKNR